MRAAVIPLQLLDAAQPTMAPHDRLGRPLRDLRISVIEACNFRCPYCMPEADYPREHGLDSRRRLGFDEIERAARAMVALGVRKLRLTGGEPLLRRGLPQLVARLARIDGVEDLALTTNGSLLAAHAAALRDAGLDRITISLDTLDPERFAERSGGRGRLSDVLDGIAAAEAAGFARLKFNCVVQRDRNEQDVLPLLRHFRGSGHVVRFIEYMDVGTCNAWQADEVVSSATLRRRIAREWPLRSLDSDYPGEVAERYVFADGAGEIGFVSSISAPFCGDCNRARLSAEGRLFTCLFGAHGSDLRPLLADGVDAGELQTRIAALWSRRGDRYSEIRAAGSTGPRVEMFHIGG